MKKIVFIFAFLLMTSGVVLAETPYFSVFSSDISDTGAKLHGSTGAGNSWNATVIGPYYYFEYGTTTSLNNSTAESTSPTPIITTLTNLQPDTTYYYRFIEKIGNTNEVGFEYNRSETKTFKTLTEIQANGGLTEAQIEGLADLGFTEPQINIILALFKETTEPGTDPRCSYTHTVTIRQGMTGEQVWKIQTALNLNTDSKFGPLTAEAVKTFQTSHGLQADGVVGAITGAKIKESCQVN